MGAPCCMYHCPPLVVQSPSTFCLRHPPLALQVWWYISGVYKGKLFVHDLATSFTQELTDYRSDAAVVCMHVSPSGFIWMGYKGGSVRVWSAATRSPICAPLRAFQSDIRWAQGLRVLPASDVGSSAPGSAAGADLTEATDKTRCTTHLLHESPVLETVVWFLELLGHARPYCKLLAGVAAACPPETDHALTPFISAAGLVGTSPAGISAAFAWPADCSG